MLSRVTAEFDSSELANIAMKRVKESVEYVYSAKFMYDRLTVNTARKNYNSAFSLIPTYYSSHNNELTDVSGPPASDEAIPVHRKRHVTTACIVCGSAAVDNVISVLSAMGGSNIRFAQ